MYEGMKTDWCVDCTHLGRCAQCDGIGHDSIPPRGYRRISLYDTVKVPCKAAGTGIKEAYKGLRYTRIVWKQQRAVLVRGAKAALKEVRRGLYHARQAWKRLLLMCLKEAKEIIKAGLKGIYSALGLLF